MESSSSRDEIVSDFELSWTRRSELAVGEGEGSDTEAEDLRLADEVSWAFWRWSEVISAFYIECQSSVVQIPRAARVVNKPASRPQQPARQPA